MKGLGFSIVAVVIMALLFGVGLLNSSPAPLLAGFCGWTPAVFFLGWSIRTLLIGKRIVLLNNEETRQPLATNNRHQTQVRGITRKENM
jgi:hypothetical protein